MFFHLSPKEGILPCIHAVFHKVSFCGPNHRIIYINNNSPGALKKALGESKEEWIANPEMMKAFLYERVTSLSELLALLQNNYDMVIIEHLDTMVQEPTDMSYSEVNKILAEVMQSADRAIFIDDWEYLQRYYVFSNICCWTPGKTPVPP